MNQKKKQYPPITGQAASEKILDWITRKDSFKFIFVLLWGYALVLLVLVYIAINIIKNPSLAGFVFSVWKLGFIPVVVVAFIHPLSGLWGLQLEERLKTPIKEYIEQHGSCTYDDLVHRFMPIKIHLGIEDALEDLIRWHHLVYEDGRYRLPTQNELDAWFEQSLEEWPDDHPED